MGHLLGSKSSLIPLIDRLNRYPVGLVDSDKLREILSILFSEEEAFVAARFPLEEATLSELSAFTEMDVDVLRPILESMADKGLVMDMPYAGTTYYLLMPGLIGLPFLLGALNAQKAESATTTSRGNAKPPQAAVQPRRSPTRS